MVRGTSVLSQSNEAKPHPLNLAEWRRLLQLQPFSPLMRYGHTKYIRTRCRLRHFCVRLNADLQDDMGQAELVSVFQRMSRAIPRIGIIGRLLAGALTNLLPVDESAVTTPEITYLNVRWIDFKHTVMAGNVQVTAAPGQLNVAIVRPPDDTMARLLKCTLCLRDAPAEP